MQMNNNMWELADRYVSASMSEQELTELKEQLANDAKFAFKFQESVNMLRALKNKGKQQDFKDTLKSIHEQHQPKPKGKTIALKTHYMRTGAFAAGIALVTSIATFFVVRSDNKKIASQYSLLKRDLEKYKRSHNELINNIQGEDEHPSAPARYSGTGFALTNDGYLVTNYHVTDGADSIYVQTKTGQYYKAFVVSFDQQADVAILKVEDSHFKFAKGDIPYTFANAKKSLSSKVFTLGFPQEEIVYSEGYISSKNGYGGDSAQYRLEIPASPGQSGAPVIDANGQIIAIITGKESESNSTTYAVSSTALLDLINNLPQDAAVSMPKYNRLSRLNREKQVEKLEDFTCSVKIYKK